MGVTGYLKKQEKEEEERFRENLRRIQEEKEWEEENVDKTRYETTQEKGRVNLDESTILIWT